MIVRRAGLRPLCTAVLLVGILAAGCASTQDRRPVANAPDEPTDVRATEYMSFADLLASKETPFAAEVTIDAESRTVTIDRLIHVRGEHPELVRTATVMSISPGHPDLELILSRRAGVALAATEEVFREFGFIAWVDDGLRLEPDTWQDSFDQLADFVESGSRDDVLTNVLIGTEDNPDYGRPASSNEVDSWYSLPWNLRQLDVSTAPGPSSTS